MNEQADDRAFPLGTPGIVGIVAVFLAEDPKEIQWTDVGWEGIALFSCIPMSY